MESNGIWFPHGTSRSVYSLLQICWHICSRSADNLQMIYRLSADHLQNVCRMSAEYLQNVCRASAAMICNKSANLQTLCRRNQPIRFKKSPQNAPIKQRLFKRQREEVGLLFIKSKRLMLIDTRNNITSRNLKYFLSVTFSTHSK